MILRDWVWIIKYRIEVFHSAIWSWTQGLQKPRNHYGSTRSTDILLCVCQLFKDCGIQQILFLLSCKKDSHLFGSFALLKWRRIMTEILQKRCCSMRSRCFDVSGSEKLLNKLSALGKAMTLMEIIPNPDSIQTNKPFIRVQVERKFKWSITFQITSK